MSTTAATARKQPKIDVRAAAEAAATYFKELYYPHVRDYSLEEVELTEDEKYWLITLSFNYSGGAASSASFLPPKTKFKVFKVDASTGKVISMRIRSLE